MISKGAKQLLEIVEELFPNQRIELEHNVAPRGGLFLDIYLPRLKIAFEFDGLQHFQYTEHFHGTRQDFVKAKKRDIQKEDLCREQNITLIRVAYNEELTKELVQNKIMEVLGG